ncbi:MAG TPA: choice-of-anchor P family protein [Gemmatimonadales bacterium]|nr:choice-of-anchor P family protein [Gemmatimonadales bacterium]
MNGKSMHWVNHLAALGLVVGLVAGLAAVGSAQSVGGQAYSTYVNTPLGSSAQSPMALLPAVSGTDGAEADAEGGAMSVAGALSSDFLNSITSGEIGAAEAGAQSTSSAASVNILNGLITADEVVANVMSSASQDGAFSSGDGSTFTNLAIAGVGSLSGDSPIAPNTNISLPGVGYVVLNEQVPTGDGVTSSGLTVNMIHVYLQSLVGGILNPLTGLISGGSLQTTGEIIVGSAASSVGP